MTPDDVAEIFARDYLIAAYVSSLGALQVGASFGRLRALLFLPWATPARIFGVALFLGGLAYFFLAPLWSQGPWSNDPQGAEVRGAEGRMVRWGKAGWSDLPRARNINDIDGGLSGTGQALWFPTGAGGALLTTLVIASIVNRKIAGSSTPPLDGFQALRSRSWPRAVPASLRHWRAAWRGELKRQFDDDREWAGLRRLVNWQRKR